MKTHILLGRATFTVALLVATTLPFSMSSEPGRLPIGPEDCLPKDPPPPTVKLKVRVPASSDPGQPLEYRICVENCSTAEAHHVIVKNALPANAKFVKSDPEPSKQGPELQWNLGTIGGGAVREIVLVLQPTNKEDVKNCVRVQFEHGVCLTTRLAASSKPPIISTVPEAIRPEDLPVLDLMVQGPKEQFANLPAKYHFTLTNKGKTKAMNAQLYVRLPDKLKAIKASEPGSAVENVVIWVLGHIEPGASKDFDLTLRATEKGEHCFKASAKADYVSEKHWDICAKFIGASALGVEMYGRKTALFVGEKTSYPVEIISQGSEPLTNIKLQVLIPDALKLETTVPALFEKRERVAGGELIEFKVLPKIDGGAQVTYEIFVEAVQAGRTVFQVAVTADQLDAKHKAVVEQEFTNIVDDRAKAQIKELSRTRSLP
ncbi:MAG: hypothetical protein HYR84_07050 [Planctomycetes bacterium]|nr:hypothetical protein [Planctomycetota bacterium]